MAKRFKVGVYEGKRTPTHRVVLLQGPNEVWAQLNGTNYPAVAYREFNRPGDVTFVIPEHQFRDRFRYVGRYKTVITKEEVFV